jgi:uncharacterized membrane protein YfcA
VPGGYRAAVPLELTPAVLVVIGAAAFLIGLSKGGVGGGLGPLITILVAVATTPSQAIGVLLPLLMIGDVAALWVHRGDWDRPTLLRLLPSAAVGIVVASVFLRQTSDRGIELFLAALSVAFVVYRIVEPRLRRVRLHAGTPLAVTAGATSGITSTVAHAGGPPVAIYLLAAGAQPVPFVATSAAFFFVVNWLKVPGYIAADLLDLGMVRVAPFALLIWPGVTAGRWLVERVDGAVFERVILVLLLAGAAYLLAG